MRFWFARASQVPIRQQLVTQVVLGILCQDLAPGQRLPGIRELARRFQLHPNTISAGYRKLARDHWVEFRRGSGVYVSGRDASSGPSSASVERLIAALVVGAREAAISRRDLRAHLRQWLEAQTPDHFLLVEPDEELRRIVAHEVRQAVALPVKECALAELSQMSRQDSAVFLVLPSKAALAARMLPASAEVLTLTVRSAPSSLASWLPGPKDVLLGIASRWTGFLDAARTMLAAAGFHPDSLVVLDARSEGWQEGIGVMAAVVCDSVTAAELSGKARIIVFPIVSDASIEDVRRCERLLAEDFPEPL